MDDALCRSFELWDSVLILLDALALGWAIVRRWMRGGYGK